MQASSGVLGAIIAGGASTRFGSPKALAVVGGVRVVDRVIAAARAAPAVAAMIAIVNDDTLASEIDLPHRADRIPGVGALGGVHTALVEARDRGHDGIFAAGCDMPFLEPGLIRALLDARAMHDVVVPESEGWRGIEPLCAYYGITCIEAIERAIARGDARMVAFHVDVDVYRLPLATVRSFGDPAVMFTNLNTEAERAAADRRAQESQ